MYKLHPSSWELGKLVNGCGLVSKMPTPSKPYEPIDTAEVYGEGHSERIVAAALADVRDKVEYATKVFANHLKYNLVIEACENSLKNLGTDYFEYKPYFISPQILLKYGYRSWVIGSRK